MGLASAEPVIKAVQKAGDKIDVVFFTTSYPTGINHAMALSEAYGIQPMRKEDIYAACSGYGIALYLLAQKKSSIVIKES